MNTPLTSHERVRRMFAREDHDRVPRFDQIWGETYERWRGEGLGDRDPLDVLGADIHFIGYLAPAPFPGRKEILREDADTEEYINCYGETVRYFKKRTGVPEHIAASCTTPEPRGADLSKWKQVHSLASKSGRDPRPTPYIPHISAAISLVAI